MKKSMVWVLVLFPAFVFSQKQNDAEELIEQFFEHYRNNGPNNAMMYALTTNKWLADSDDIIHYSLFHKLGKITSHLGNYIGTEVINSKMVSSRVAIFNYMVYYEKQPLLFTFELYNHDGTWEFADVEYEQKPEKILAGAVSF